MCTSALTLTISQLSFSQPLVLYQLAYHSCMVNPQRSFAFVKTIYLYTWRSIHFYNIDVIICILCSLMKSGVTQVIFIVYNNLHSADKHFSWTKGTIMMMLHSYMQTGSACMHLSSLYCMPGLTHTCRPQEFCFEHFFNNMSTFFAWQ